MKDKKQKRIIIFLCLGLVLLDQILKAGIIFLGKTSFQNLERQALEENIKYILLSIIAIGVLIRYIKSNNLYITFATRIILSFAVAGAISNMLDRIIRGYVVNYISIPNFAEINLAYIYIIIMWIGMAVILTKNTYKTFRKKQK